MNSWFERAKAEYENRGPRSKARETLLRMRLLQATRDLGQEIAEDDNPANVLDMEIGQRAGWVKDPGPFSFGIAQPVDGKLPRAAEGDAQTQLRVLARRLNSPSSYFVDTTDIPKNPSLRRIGREVERRFKGRLLDPRILDPRWP